MIDLGVSITPCFDFRNHYTRCTNKAMRTLGFICRVAKHFRDGEALRLLYVALVRPHVEYASVIWNPRHTKYVKLIERVQHKFLRFVARVLGNPMDRTDHDYGPVLQSMNISTLADRRQIAYRYFLYKVINDLVNCSDLVELISFNAPEKHLRKKPLFAHKLPLYSYYTIDPINRAMRYADQQFNEIDPFIGSLSSFRAKLFSQLANSRMVY